MHILITGGAGYIGSHVARNMQRQGYMVTVLDDLSSGHREAISDIQLVEGDCGQRADIDALFSSRSIDAVMHFASHILVGESVHDPAKYYRNNLISTLALLDSMRAHGVNIFIFSSSAAVYGVPESTPIAETHPCFPVNPYGSSKHILEVIAQDYAHAYGLRFGSLRYFNAAGADAEGLFGEAHYPETHLIPLALQTALGRRGFLDVYGTDYPTPDGTAIRDYVHVEDLADAHIRLLGYVQAGGGERMFNVGAGQGYSVKEVITVAEKCIQRRIPTRIKPRREGDPAILVGDIAKAKQILGWQPQHSSLPSILTDAWKWEQKRRY